MIPVHLYMQEYKRFMTSFLKQYPEVYAAYSRNISVGRGKSVQISVNNYFNIPFEMQQQLLIIATDYYYLPKS